ncbi:MAG TPA: hypothetical protein VI540_03680 [Gaiellaceae bacterium]|nr:hypothetical protein [Gaiellaceae bacterium]
MEILSTGGPVHAIGSPPEGDHYTKEQLRAMVDAANELAGELQAPSRIGHRKMGESQEGALRSSPAVGWLSNHRLNADGTKYLADIKKVPKVFGELVKAGAYRKRSAELSSITSQKTGKTYDLVVTGLAWLGDRLPAISTLEDVVKLYEGDAERRVLVIYENPPAKPELVELLLEHAAEALFRELDPGSGATPADTRAMKFSEKQRKQFAEATGLEADKVTDEMLGAAGITGEQPAPIVSDDQAKELASLAGVEGDDVTADKLLEALKRKNEHGGDDTGEENERYKELERRLEAAEKTSKDTAEELRVERRNGFVEDAIKVGKIAPGAREKLERLFDKDSEGAKDFVSELKPDEELVREHGSDQPSAEEKTEQEQLEKAYEADLASRMNVKVEELI